MSDSPRASATASPPSAGPTIDLRPDERWFFVGKTGSGKTFLARRLLAAYAARGWPVVIVDPKGAWAREWARKGPGTLDHPRLITTFDEHYAVQCYQPRIPGYSDPDLLALFDAVFERQNIVLYVDELYGIVTPSQQPPQFMRVWAQGRSQNVAAWAASQRPARIPELVMSQAENWAVFRLTNPEDLDRVASYTGSPAIAATRLAGHSWWYWNERADNARLMRPIHAH